MARGDDGIQVSVADIETVLKRVFPPSLLPEQEAAVLIDTLIDAELRGVKSHGLSRVKMYRQKILNGSMVVPTRLERLADRQATARLDGQDGLGQWIAYRAMSDAIAKAAVYGVGAVSVCNSQHFGTAGYYAQMATEKNMVGMVFTNASPRLAPWGGATPMLGNNPWSIALPTHVAGIPFVLDISNAVSSAGRIRLAAKRGEPIPETWALDKDGNPTTDPVAALAGILLPFGAHKGYGITLAVSMLTSLLAGGVPDARVETMDDPDRVQRVSHFFIALNIDFFLPVSDFKREIQALIGRLHGSQKLPQVKQIYYPGERGYQQKKMLLAAGSVYVDAAIWQGILALAG
ncbi:MAG TPA: Ldh family oxidoreductase [Pseudolabrys sp.]|nr:Ldh family oxidoreductase [Pseudolabrys sp.]